MSGLGTDPMQTDQPNAAERAGPVSEKHLRMRLVGLTKAVDAMEPGAREFCLAAISETLDYIMEYQAAVRTLRAEVERLHEVRQSVIRENQKAWKRTREAESALASEWEKVATLRAEVGRFLEDKPHFAERCGPDYDEGCVCQAGRMAAALDTTNEGAETG